MSDPRDIKSEKKVRFQITLEEFFQQVGINQIQDWIVEIRDDPVKNRQQKADLGKMLTEVKLSLATGSKFDTGTIDKIKKFLSDNHIQVGDVDGFKKSINDLLTKEDANENYKKPGYPH